ncbi:MAG: murein biosynthesis integral membrane protein MurJ [Patescibacteria group bacterium]|nr:murein biosynthesis integral membrane protein MurJ [Patescibacteria group bacterium]MDD5490609.1 murein biosynthesis integral membrane protein MurJ [Patescibacteria group bacterium]
MFNFNGKANNVTVAAIIVGVSGLLSRFLGIFRDHILAGQFGAGDTLDIYYAAFRIPDLIYNLLVLGALSAGFIPVFTKYLGWFSERREKISGEAGHFINSLFNIVSVALIFICSLLVIFSSRIVPWITPGFSGEKLEFTIALTRIMFLSPIFLGLSSILGGILQSFRRFFIYSLAPIMYNIGIIFGALFFVPKLGISGLAWGVVLGAGLHFIIQIPAVASLGWSYRWAFDIYHSGVRLLGKLMIPRTLALAVTQINLVIITIIASTLEEGSLTVFNLANNLQSFPIGIFGISYAIAVFPFLSEYAVKDKKEELVKSFSSALRQIIFFVVPASVLFLLLRAQIVRVILGSGQFDWNDTISTADTLAFFSFSLFAQAIIPLLARVFYAFENTFYPFVIGLMSAVLNIFASLLLAPQYGVAGLAMAFSVANIFNFVLLWVALRIKVGNLDEINILYSLVKISAAALAMAVVVQSAKFVVAPFVNMDKFWGIFSQGFIAGAGGLIIYLGICLVVKSPEMISFKDSLVRKLFKSKLPPSSADESRGI